MIRYNQSIYRKQCEINILSVKCDKHFEIVSVNQFYFYDYLLNIKKKKSDI